MLTKPQLKTIIVNNLQSPYMHSIQLFVNELLVRGEAVGDVPMYRIKNLSTDTYITTLDEFISAIDDTKLVNYYAHETSRDITVVQPFMVKLSNIEVTIATIDPFDSFLASKYGTGIKVPVLTMTYLNDLDTTIPLKIIHISLHHKGH